MEIRENAQRSERTVQYAFQDKACGQIEPRG